MAWPRVSTAAPMTWPWGPAAGPRDAAGPRAHTRHHSGLAGSQAPELNLLPSGGWGRCQFLLEAQQLLHILRKASGIFLGARVRQEVLWTDGTVAAGGTQSSGWNSSPGGPGW